MPRFHQKHHANRAHDSQRETTQTVLNNTDGSVEIDLVTTGFEDKTFERTVTVSEDDVNDEVDIVIETASDRTTTFSISEDDDGGIDVDIEKTLRDGTVVTKHIELDMNDDGSLSFDGIRTDHEGETHNFEHDIQLSRFLGSDTETLTLENVVETYLERAGVDTDAVDIAGIIESASGDLG